MLSTVSMLLAQALRGLARHRTRSALNALGITIGVASVVWVIAIGQAGSARAEEQLHALGDNLVWVEAGSRNANGVRTGAYGMRSLKMEDAQAILREVPTIRRVSPQVDGSVVVAWQTKNWTTHYRGVSPDFFEIKRCAIAAGVAFSDEDVERGRHVCVLGQTVRDRLFGEDNAEGQVIRVAGQPFEVVGVLAPKGQSASGQDQDDTILVPYTTAMKNIRGGGQIWLDDVLCSAFSPQSAREAANDIASLMRQRHHIQPDEEDDFNIRHPEELINAQIRASATLEALLVSIASVSLLVGGIGVMNVMLASVVERTREIGVRLAVGAPAWAIESQFLVEAALLTALGGAAGVVVSLSGSWIIARVLGWPLPIPWHALADALTLSIGTGLVFGFVPARRAARLDPVTALHS
jgi:putative ABC transport system permease protein